MAVTGVHGAARSPATFQVHVSGVAIPPADTGPDLEDDDPEVRWSVLRYRRGPKASRDRATLWRELQAHHAVKLKQGLWAVRHDESGAQPCLESLALLEHAGGVPSFGEVRPDSLDFADLRARLEMTCDALWDSFFHAADRVVASVNQGDAESRTMADMEGLRALYRTALCGDVLRGEGSRRAERRLQTAELAAVAAIPSVAAFGPEWRRRCLAGSRYAWWPLADGRVRYALEVEPAVPLAVERALLRFESVALRSDGDEPVLRGGLFEFIARPVQRDDRIAAVNRRLRLFQLSLD